MWSSESYMLHSDWLINRLMKSSSIYIDSIRRICYGNVRPCKDVQSLIWWIKAYWTRVEKNIKRTTISCIDSDCIVLWVRVWLKWVAECCHSSAPVFMEIALTHSSIRVHWSWRVLICFIRNDGWVIKRSRFTRIPNSRVHCETVGINLWRWYVCTEKIIVWEKNQLQEWGIVSSIINCLRISSISNYWLRWMILSVELELHRSYIIRETILLSTIWIAQIMITKKYTNYLGQWDDGRINLPIIFNNLSIWELILCRLLPIIACYDDLSCKWCFYVCGSLWKVIYVNIVDDLSYQISSFDWLLHSNSVKLMNVWAASTKHGIRT